MKPDFGAFLADNLSDRQQAFEPMMPSVSPSPEGSDISFLTVAEQEMYCGTIRVRSTPLDALIDLTCHGSYLLGTPSDLIGCGVGGEEFRLIQGQVAPLSSLGVNGHLLTMLRKEMAKEDRRRRRLPPPTIFDLMRMPDLAEMIDVGEQSSADVVSILGHLVLDADDHIFALTVLHEDMLHYALLKSSTATLEAQEIFSDGEACIDFVGTPSQHRHSRTHEEHNILLGAFRRS